MFSANVWFSPGYIFIANGVSPARLKFSRRALVWLLALLVIAPRFTAAADDAPKARLIVGSELNFPPFVLVREGGEPDGFAVELWRAVAREAHLDGKIVTGLFHENLARFKNGEIDLLVNLAPTEERRRFADFSVPHVRMTGAVFTRKGVSGIASENDLAKKSLIVIKFDSAHEYARSRGWSNLTVVDKASDGMQLLATSTNHDAMLIGRLVGLQTVRTLKLEDQIRPLGIRLSYQQDFAFAVRKGEADLLARINECLANLRASGAYDAIYARWFGGLEPMPIMENLLHYILPALLAILLLGAAYLHERSLRMRWRRTAAELDASIAERDRKQAELEEAHVALTNAMPGIARLDTEGRYVAVNDMYAAMLGYEAAELIGSDWARTVADEDRSRGLAAYARMLEVGKGEFEARAVRKDGGVFFKQVLMVKIADEQGHHAGHHCFMRDITERKVAESERDRLAAIVASSGDAIISRDLDFRILSCNAAAERLLGYSADELIGNYTDMFVSPEMATVIERRRALIHRGIQPTPLDSVWITRDGRRIDVSVTQSPINGPSGQLVGVSLSVRDISERKALEAERTRLANIVENSGDAIVSRDLDLKILTWNRAAERLLGHRAEEVIGKPLDIVNPPEMAALVAQRRELIDRGTVTAPVDKVWLTKDGRRVDVSVSQSPVRDANGKTTSVSLIVRDITERRRRAKSLRLTQFSMDRAVDGLFWIKPSAEIVYANDAACRMLGYACAELIGKTVPDIDPNFPAEVWPDHWAELKQKGALTFESPRRTRDGRMMETEVTANYIQFEGEEYNCAIMRDITARKAAELALQTSESSIRRLYRITNARELSFEHRVRALLGFACERFRIPYGFLTNVVGEELEITYVHGPDNAFPEGTRIAMGAAYCSSTMAADEPICYEHVGASEWRTHPGYAALGMECYMGAKVVVDGEVSGTVCFLGSQPHDSPFTAAEKDFLNLMAVWLGGELEKHRAHDQLRRAHDHMRQVIDIDPNFIFAKDREGRFTLVNKAVADAYGTTVEELVGMTDADFNSNAAEVELYRQKDLEVMDSLCEQFIAEETITDRDGNTRWLQTVKRPILDDAGRATQVLGSATDITARKLAEEALRESERHLLNAQSIAHLGSWERSFRTGRSKWSDEIYRIFGYQPGSVEPSYDLWVAAIHPDDRSRVQGLRLAFKDSSSAELEFRILRPDGEVRHIHWRGEMVRDSAGAELLVAGTVLDITERKRAEAALRRAYDGLERRVEERTAELQEVLAALSKTEALLQQAVDVANLGIYERDHLTDAVYYAPGLRKILDLQDDEPLGLGSYSSRLHPDDREMVSAARQRAHDPSGHGFLSLEHRIVRSDGSVGWVVNRARTVFEGTGQSRKPMHTVGAVLDITERKRAEEALRESEGRLRAILDHSPAPVFIKDTAGRYVHVNRRFEELFEISSAKALGKSDAELFGAEQAVLFQQHDRRVLDSGMAMQFEEVARYHDGVHTSLVNKFPLRDSLGAIYGLCGIATDITERKQAEDALRKLSEGLDRRVVERTRELAESQARLRALVGEISKAEERERRRLAVELHDYLAQMLTVSRLNLGRATKVATGDVLKQRLSDAQQSIDESIAYTRSLMAQLSPRVLYDLGLPAALSWLAGQQRERHGLEVEVIGAADGFRLDEESSVLAYQCVRELLWNVVKHAQAQRAVVRYELVDGGLNIGVSDDGRGFEPATLQQPTGGAEQFGLFSIRERLELRGGRLDVWSRPGQGTRVDLRMPVLKLDEPIAGASQAAPTIAAAAAVPRVSVAVVDDHAVVRRGLRQALEEFADFNVVGEAQDGLEGLDLVRHYRPDVVIMDINMPGINGVEATRQIIQEMPATVVVGLSFETGHEVVQAMIAAGATTCITKERAVEDIHQAIMEALAERRRLAMH